MATSKPSKRIAWVVFFIAGALIVALFLPLERVWPVPYAEYEGRLDGQSVTVPLHSSLSDPPSPGSTVNVRIAFEMDEGTFRATYPKTAPGHFIVGGKKGDYPVRLPANKTLVLDPGGGRGRYEVEVGNAYHPLARPFRRLAAFSLLGGLGLGLVLRLLLTRATIAARLRPYAERLRKLERRKWLPVVVAFALTSFLYSTVHEFGHYIVAVGLGVPVKRVVWTVLSGEAPHVELAVQPTGWVHAWMTASGTLFPSVGAFLLLAFWHVSRTKILAWVSLATLAASFALLLPNVSGVIDAVRYLGGTHPWHMASMGEQLGLGRGGTAVFCTLPTIATIVIVALVVRRAVRKGKEGPVT